MPRETAMRAAIVAIGANAFLLALKATASGLSDSLTIFSETLNSLSDCAAAVVTVLCVRWAWMSPDPSHPFGHRRAEPLAGLIVAIFAGILGFEVCRTAVVDLWRGKLPQSIGPYPAAALIITAFTKTGLAAYFFNRGRQLNSPALRATAVDCRNDVLIATQGLIGVILAQYHVGVLDRVAALIVGLYILYSAQQIGMENIDYLMGRAPERALLDQIRIAAEGVPRVQRLDNLTGHYVGTFVHVELTVYVDGGQSTTDSHEVAEAVRSAVEAIANVDRAFVHLEPTPAASDLLPPRPPA